MSNSLKLVQKESGNNTVENKTKVALCDLKISVGNNLLTYLLYQF